MTGMTFHGINDMKKITNIIGVCPALANLLVIKNEE